MLPESHSLGCWFLTHWGQGGRSLSFRQFCILSLGMRCLAEITQTANFTEKFDTCQFTWDITPLSIAFCEGKRKVNLHFLFNHKWPPYLPGQWDSLWIQNIVVHLGGTWQQEQRWGVWETWAIRIQVDLFGNGVETPVNWGWVMNCYPFILMKEAVESVEDFC